MGSVFFSCLSFILVFSQTALASLKTNDYDVLIERFTQQGVKALYTEKPFIDAGNEDLVELGRLLFFDNILSGNKNISCATCHFPSKASSDGLPLPIGTGGKGLGEKRIQADGHIIPRNAPTAFNMAFPSFHVTMWDGRISFDPISKALTTPEPLLNGPNPVLKDITQQLQSVAAAQAMFPVTSHHEMRGDSDNEIANAQNNIEVWDLLTDRLVGTDNGEKNGIPKYLSLFQKAYPEIKSRDEFNFGHVARAIAAFEMFGFQADRSDFDFFLQGDSSALTRSQFRGAQIFSEKGKCLACHNGPHLTDFKFYATSVPQLGPGKMPILGEAFGEDLGLAHITGNDWDNYKFKTPSLRNVSLTGPWSHSGSCTDLKDFIKLHVGPDEMLNHYLDDPGKYLQSKSEVDYVSLIDNDQTRNENRLLSRDSILRNISLNDREFDDLFEFLKTLSDKSYQNRVRIPKAVPSGLEVDHW